MVRKNGTLFAISIFMFLLIACGADKSEKKLLVDKTTAITELSTDEKNMKPSSEDNETEIIETKLTENPSKNYSLILQAYKKSKDYEWLSNMQFSPCKAIEEQFADLPDGLRKIYDFKFEKCGIWDTKTKDDIIMKVNVETELDGFELTIVFIKDNEVYNPACVLTSNGVTQHELIDVNGDNNSEIIFSNLKTDYRYGWLRIYQCKNKSKMDVIYEDNNVDLAQYKLAYELVEEDFPMELIITKDKTYINTDDQRKIAETMKYYYRYDGHKFVLDKKEKVRESNMDDYKTDMLG